MLGSVHRRPPVLGAEHSPFLRGSSPLPPRLRGDAVDAAMRRLDIEALRQDSRFVPMR